MKFIYVHILKTAGTTLRHSIFERYYKGKYLYDATFKPKFYSKRPDHPVTIEPQPYPTNYDKYDVIFGHFKHDKYEDLNWPMFSFVRHPVRRLIDQYYYHKGYYKKKIKIEEFADIWANHMSYVLGDISKYKFIGVVEKFDDSLKMFCKKIGKSPIQKPGKKRYFNDDKIKKTSKAVRRYIESVNKEDMELYKEISGRIK
jgi:hypothetical protein